MPTPGEHKTEPPSPSGLRRSGARILAYAEAIHLRQGYVGQVGWTIVSREEAERRREITAMTNGEGRMTNASLFFDDLLDVNPPPPRGYGVAGVLDLFPKRKRRLRVNPKTAFRPSIPSPNETIARNKEPAK